MSSTDLDAGYEVTHDDPGHAATQLENRRIEMRALALAPFVWWRHSSGVQYKAIITRVHAPELVDLLVLPEARISLGAAEACGAPRAITDVALGSGHFNFQTELDP